MITVIDLAHASAACQCGWFDWRQSNQHFCKHWNTTRYAIYGRPSHTLEVSRAVCMSYTTHSPTRFHSAIRPRKPPLYPVSSYFTYIRHEHSFAPIHSNVTFRLISRVAFSDKCPIVRPLSHWLSSWALCCLLLPTLKTISWLASDFAIFGGITSLLNVDYNSPRLLWKSPRAPCLSLDPERSTTRLALALRLQTRKNLPRPWFGVEFSISWLHGTLMNTFVVDSLLFVRELSK